MIKASTERKADYPVDPFIIDRWSPRAMSGEALEKDLLLSLFEAARWAPSCFNEQPWRFLYAMQGSEAWDRYFDFLVDANKAWAEKAGALVLILAKKTFERNGKPNYNHLADSGAAWQNLALAGYQKNLVVHGMAGFHMDKARSELGLSDDFAIVHMAAIGHPGNREDLPEAYQGKEIISGRKPVSEIASEASLP